jgi:hypothetical protein
LRPGNGKNRFGLAAEFAASLGDGSTRLHLYTAASPLKKAAMFMKPAQYARFQKAEFHHR